MTQITKAWMRDTAERVGSTVAEAGLGWLITYLTTLPATYTILFAGGLAVLKAQIAKLAPDTVSPSSLAPAPDGRRRKPRRRLRRREAGAVPILELVVYLIVLAIVVAVIIEAFHATNPK